LFFNLVLPFLRQYPMIITIHDPRQHLGDRESRLTPQWLMDFGFRRADQVIVHGSDLVGIVEKEIGFQRGQIHVIPHIAIGERPEPPADLEIGPNILFFGRIWEYKGLDYLIKAEPVVSAEFPDVRFVIGGTGEDFDRYRRQMVHPERFTVHNEWISDADRARMFSEASVVVLPYVEASQSGVIPIAYTHGKPVIATTVGGLPDMVEHGQTGLLVPPRDSDALAAAIIKLLRWSFAKP
jgi:glycosyltransferase involved in cell wall biosynthesis